MAQESMLTLRADLESTRAEVRALKEKASQLETWLKGIAIAALIFGIGAGAGGIALSSAHTQLQSLKSGADAIQQSLEASKRDLLAYADQRKAELATYAVSSAASAVREQGASPRLQKVEIQLAAAGTEKPNVVSGQPVGQKRSDMVAACPAGQVAKGVKLHLGGTCNSQCSGDGQPVTQLEVICVVH